MVSPGAVPHLSPSDVTWRSQNFTLGTTEVECRRRENRGAEDAEGWDWEDVSPSPTDWGYEEASCSPSIYKVHRTLVERTAGPTSQQGIFSVKNHSIDDRGLAPLSPSAYTVFQKSDAKIQITITMAHLIRINYPLSSFNYRLSGTNVANFNKIHHIVSEQQLF